MYLLLIALLLLFILLNKKETFQNVCTGYLTDIQYLEHMIPHHQVAIDISYELQKKTKWPFMQHLLRKLIWVQEYEISMMKEMIRSFPTYNNRKKRMNRNYIYTLSDFVKPNKLGFTKTYCDPHFFDPEKHKKHLSHMKLDDKMYIKHMIPHHQVAVDMSKKLLKHTKNDFMIYLAYRIIRSQQDEIILLNDLLQSTFKGL